MTTNDNQNPYLSNWEDQYFTDEERDMAVQPIPNSDPNNYEPFKVTNEDDQNWWDEPEWQEQDDGSLWTPSPAWQEKFSKHPEPKWDTTPDRYYFAYGSNLHVPQMAKRCVDSEPVAVCTLHDWRLVFRGVADIEPAEGFNVLGSIYKISEWDEKMLDQYEAFPHLYGKGYFDVQLPDDDQTVRVMFYRMNENGYSLPSKGYFDVIADGFVHWGLDTDALMVAIKHADSNGRMVHPKQFTKPRGYAKYASRGVLADPAKPSLASTRIQEIRQGREILNVTSTIPAKKKKNKSKRRGKQPAARK
jgi:gamma-glutamylcyclotransferase (GGCT)/AIG2-like uncharacterized protein YtfP